MTIKQDINITIWIHFIMLSVGNMSNFHLYNMNMEYQYYKRLFSWWVNRSIL